jgi:hypothetical protein
MNMTNNKDDKYNHYTKMAWIIYTLLTIALIAVLVLFVAQDTEERFKKPFSKLIFKLTGVSHPTEKK